MIEISDGREEARPFGISQLSFRRIIENIADGLLVVDLSGSVLYANPAASQIFGQPIEKLVHVPLGRPVVDGETTEITVHRPDLAPADIEMRIVEIDWDGQAALVASLRDVSAQRALEARQRQSQKLEAIGRVAAGVAHDFNNLLAAFQSCLNMLERQLSKDPAASKVDTLIEELKRRVENGGALTHQLVSFSRRQSLSPEIIDVNDRIRSLTELLNRTLGSEVKLHCDLMLEAALVSIDPNQLDVAILNLAVNARDAMPDGGTFTLQTSKVTEDVLEPRGGVKGSFICISVRDTGCGMSKDALSRAFEPFFTTKDPGKGTGLGLSQVHGFVSQSGGHVRIDSQVGKGTSVHLLLPCA